MPSAYHRYQGFLSVSVFTIAFPLKAHILRARYRRCRDSVDLGTEEVPQHPPLIFPDWAAQRPSHRAFFKEQRSVLIRLTELSYASPNRLN